jgi:hypothetical protein
MLEVLLEDAEPLLEGRDTLLEARDTLLEARDTLLQRCDAGVQAGNILRAEIRGCQIAVGVAGDKRRRTARRGSPPR